MTRFIAPILILVFAALTGCGESSRVTGSGSSVAGVTLMSISVGPPGTTVALGITTQFSATGVYSDGSKTDVSTSVSWSSSAPNVATISDAIGSIGKATPVATGTTTITATLAGVKGSTTLTVSPATLVSIAITPASSGIPAGTQSQFTATGTYSDETTKNITASVTWNSSSLTVATVSNTAGSQGLVTAVGAGSTTISATLNTITASTTLTVTAESLLSIAVTPAMPSIPSGLSQQFVATGTYTNGTTQSTQNITASVTWTSSNSAAASISNTAGSQGKATGASVGTVTITATLGTVSNTATLTVTPAALVSVAVMPANPSIAKGTHEQFVATGTYTDGTTQVLTTMATWVSSAPNVATISNSPGFDGYAIGVGTGSSIISATVSGIAGSTTLTVTPATLVSIGVTPTDPTIPRGYFEQFTATGIYTDNSTQDLTTSVMWTSSNPNASVISSAAPTQGRASGLNPGVTMITATLSGVSGSTTLYVTAATLTSITVTPAAPSIVAGTTEAFTATGTFSDNSQENLTTSVMWTSGTTAVATISNASPTNGVATAVAAGTSTITATLGGVHGATTLTVTAATLTSITVTPVNPSIALGTTQQFIATGNYSNGSMQNLTTAVTWSSSSSGAPISNAAGSAGLATGMSQGTATITATLGAVSGNTTLTITAAALMSIAVTPTNAVISVGTTQQFVATGTYTDSTTAILTTSATWTSSAGNIAGISNAASSEGLATAVSAGTTQIVATIGTIASPGVTLTVKPATYAYVTNASGATISQYIVGLGGVLTPQATPTLSNSNGYNFSYPFAVTVDKTNTFVYVADNAKNGPPQNARIFQFRIGTDGGLVPLSPAYIAVAAAAGPNSVTLDPAGKFLYVAEDNSGYVDQFKIDPTAGTLTMVDHVQVGGGPVTVTFRPDGRFAYVSNIGTGTDGLSNRIYQYSVDQSNGATAGNLTPLVPASVAGGNLPEGMAFDPTGMFLFAADTGGKAIAQFTDDPTTGLLTPNGSVTGGPSDANGNISLTFDLTGTYVYVVANNSQGSYGLLQYKLAANGTLVPLTPSHLIIPNQTQYIAVDPTNHFVYAVIRGNSTVSIFGISPTDGTLTPASNPSVATGTAPTSLATTH